MVSEVQVDDDELADQLLKETQGTPFNINAHLIGKIWVPMIDEI